MTGFRLYRTGDIVRYQLMILHFYCDLNKFCGVYKCIMCSWDTKLNKLCSLTKSWIRSAYVLKISSIQKSGHRRSYFYVHFLISEYLSRPQKITITHVNNKTVLFYSTVFFLLSNKFISNISNSETKLILEYQMICNHIFQIRSRIILLRCFSYVLSLYIFLLVCGNYTHT